MKIRTRFLFSTIFCLGMSLVIGVIVFFTWRQANEAVKHHTVATEVVKGVFELNLLTNDCLLHRHEERPQRQWQSRHDSLTRLLSGDQFKRPRQRVILDRIRQDLEDMKTLFSQLHIVQPGDNREKTALSVRQEARLIARLMTKSQAMVSRAFQLAETSVLDIGAAQDRANLLVMFLIVFIVVAAAATSIWVGRSVLKPVRELQKGTEIIGAGNLDHKVGTAARDEIGHLSRAFDQMTEKLKTITVSRDDLAKEVSQRKRVEKELRKHRENLEKMVEDLNKTSKELIERTAELTAANVELEAFSYSVSHDLRAPLRSMDGFSQVLLEDYADKLDAQGKDSLQRVRRASQRMAQLIDDLLELSRVTRREIKRESVDLSELARDIAGELQKAEPERKAKFTIQKGVLVTGDLHLLRLAMENLLGNAWKFTGKHPSAAIEFGITEAEGKPTYFVRDDGVGFDMAYADKLFGAFQRLHSTSEFPGTGIGLATVKRIIDRHGGRVWAEAAVDKGATFYFAL